jgi:hypothetical protein
MAAHAGQRLVFRRVHNGVIGVDHGRIVANWRAERNSRCWKRNLKRLRKEMAPAI